MDPNTNLVIGTGNDETLSGTESDAQFTLIGGAGNDTYIIDSPNGDNPDVVIEQTGSGIDTVVLTDNGGSDSWAASSYVLTDNVENLRTDFTYGSGIIDIEIQGNALNNIIITGAGDDTLVGGAGSDTLSGGDGSDVYYVDSATDVVIEQSNAGADDGVIASVNFTLGANIENLALLEGAGNLTGTGNALDNEIDGNTGNNLLSGLAGNDELIGDLGNDTLLGGDGNDVLHGDHWELDAGLQGGNDSLDGGNGNDTLWGGFGKDTMLGGAGNDTLYGVSFATSYMDAGADSLVGGVGDDTYYAAFGDAIVEVAAGGNDTVYLYGGASSATYVLAANIENGVLWDTSVTRLTGNASDNRLVGGYGGDVLTGLAGNDALDGKQGADTLVGGDGNDSYIVDNSGDKVIETNALTSGIDTVYSNLSSYTLSANVENLVLVYGGFASGTGNALNNTITGNSNTNYLSGGAGSDTINGGAGGDWMIGGSGNDTYVVDNRFDHISEIAETNGGTADKVIITADYAAGYGGSYFMTSNLEILDSSANFGNLYVHANGSANTITTGVGNDTIDGAVGADTMAGGKGNDVYFVDNANDVVKENLGEGTDSVYDLSVNSYTLAANVENLFLGGVNANGTGNILANQIVGNSANNKLDGGDGNDTLLGGYGQDTLIGGNGDDILDGGAKADSLSGGLGNDIYIIDNAGDVVAGETGGIDTIRTSLSTFNLGASTVAGGVVGIDHLIYSGHGDFTGTGNLLANSIVGGDGDDTLVGAAGNDTLFGGSGADSMSGGTGDDTYYVADFNDVIIEDTTALGGKDTVISSVNYTLGSNLENLKLTGDANIGTGNTLANTITSSIDAYGGSSLSGDAGNDTLIGGNWGDQLDGGIGADSMVGGLGNDSYIVDNVGDVVVETTADSATGGWDTVFSSVNFTLGANIENLILQNGAGNLSGTGNLSDNGIFGNNGNNTLSGLAGNDFMYGGTGNDTLLGGDGNDSLDGGDGNDIMTGGAGDDFYHVSSSGDVVVEALGGGTDWVWVDGSITSYTLGANIENLEIGEVSADSVTGGFTATGNGLDNIMYGSWAVANALDGAAGNDTFWLHLATGTEDTVKGGLGIDTLNVSIGDQSGTTPYGDILWTNQSVTSDLSSGDIEKINLTVNGGMYGGWDTYGGHVSGGFTGDHSWDVNGLHGVDSAHAVNFTIMGGYGGHSGSINLENIGANVNFTFQDYHLFSQYGGATLQGVYGGDWVGTGDVLQVTLNNSLVGLTINGNASGYGGIETLKIISTGGVQNDLGIGGVHDDLGNAAVVDVSGDTTLNIDGISAGTEFKLHDFTSDFYVQLDSSGSLSIDISNVSAWIGSDSELQTLDLNVSDSTGDLLDVSGLDGGTVINITGGTAGSSLLDLQGVRQTVDASTYEGDLLVSAYGGSNVFAGSGNDYLIGSWDNDFLAGNDGEDVLTGNGGSDQFYFGGGDSQGIDLITDFTSGQDSIVVNTDNFSGLAFYGGTLDVGSFYSSDNADDSDAGTTSAIIMYDTSTGALYYDADGSGSGAAVQFAQLGLTGAANLSASDIVQATP